MWGQKKIAKLVNITTISLGFMVVATLISIPSLFTQRNLRRFGQRRQRRSSATKNSEAGGSARLNLRAGHRHLGSNADKIRRYPAW